MVHLKFQSIDRDGNEKGLKVSVFFRLALYSIEKNVITPRFDVDSQESIFILDGRGESPRDYYLQSIISTGVVIKYRLDEKFSFIIYG